MKKELNKHEIIKNITAEIAYRFENEKHNNGTKKIKGLRVLRGLTDDYLTDGMNYLIQVNPTEFGYHINNGELYEIDMNHKDGNKITHCHYKGEKDNNKKIFTEYKSLHDIGTTVKMTVEEIETVGGVIVGTVEGDYYITGKKLRENINELPNIKIGGKNYKRLYIGIVRKLGTLRTDNSKYL